MAAVAALPPATLQRSVRPVRSLPGRGRRAGAAADDGTLSAFARFQRGLCRRRGRHRGRSAGVGGRCRSARRHSPRRNGTDSAAHVAAPGLRRLSMDRGRWCCGAPKRGVCHAGTGAILGEHPARLRASGEALQRFGDGLAGLALTYATLGMPDEATAMHRRAHDAYACGMAMGTCFAHVDAGEPMRWYCPIETARHRGAARLMEETEGEQRQASGGRGRKMPSDFVWLPVLRVEGRWEEAVRLAVTGSDAGSESLACWVSGSNRRSSPVLCGAEPDRAWWADDEYLPLRPARPCGDVVSFTACRLRAARWRPRTGRGRPGGRAGVAGCAGAMAGVGAVRCAADRRGKRCGRSTSGRRAHRPRARARRACPGPCQRAAPTPRAPRRPATAR